MIKTLLALLLKPIRSAMWVLGGASYRKRRLEKLTKFIRDARLKDMHDMLSTPSTFWKMLYDPKRTDIKFKKRY